MRDLQRRIEELRQQLTSANGGDLSPLEQQARELLSEAKNTPYEADAQALFAEIAQRSSNALRSGGDNPTVRGLLRRARIRIEMAGDDDDVDEAIDILTEAISLNPQDADVIQLLQQAAASNPQAAKRVSDLFNRYGVAAEAKPAPEVPPPPPPQAAPPPSQYDAPRYEPGPGNMQERQAGPDPEQTQTTQAVQQSPNNQEAQQMMSELTEDYYAGNYQKAIDLANRLLTLDPNNTAAIEYRQKSEDNLIRGVVPDHRIPFDARVAYNRANSLVRAGNYDEAAKLYREAREIAERDGILSWKDVEQALLEIQDLALARELLNEGDRLMAADNWNEAMRKYQGALGVVPNDPQAEERIEMIKKVQEDTDSISVELSMLGGPVEEQVSQLLAIRTKLARIRQLLPTSQRLIDIQNEVDGKLNGARNQLHDQATSSLNRVSNAAILEDKLALTNEALRLLEAAVELNPSDTLASEVLMEGRAMAADMERDKQTIERAASLVAQNMDSELTQALTMLSDLSEHSQDERYRSVINDLFSRYLERAENAVEQNDMGEAKQWLSALHDEPFRFLGRRTEIFRLESIIRSQRNRARAIGGGIIIVIFFILGGAALATRPQWEAALFPTQSPTPLDSPTPSNTPTPTMSLTPSDTPQPSNTPTPSDTPSLTPTLTATQTSTASLTPTNTSTATFTVTPSPTWTPSFTPTASMTPTHTDTPTHTPTRTHTPTVTLTPSVTTTPPPLCQLIANPPSDASGIRLREDATTQSAQLAVLSDDTVMDALETSRERTTGALWYRVRLEVDGEFLFGWVREDTVNEFTPCPAVSN